MIRNQWYVILESKEVKCKPKSFKRLGEDLVLWRDKDNLLHCLVNRCCHRGAALHIGKLLENGTLQCPFHGFEYDGNGKCTCIPANSRNVSVPENYKVPSYPVHEEHGWIWIYWGDGKQAVRNDGLPADRASSLSINADISKPAKKPQYFPDIETGFDTSTVKDPWKTHYSRVLENQLDVVHVPFVHYNTIGRGNKTVVDGPGVKWIDDRMLYTYVFNRVDDGSKPRKPEEVPVPPPNIEYKLEMIMPNLWQNRISSKLRIVGAFVPVDDKNTLLYLKTYRKFLQIPVLSTIVGWLFGQLNLYIAHQDRRVVQTQTPFASDLRGGEQLIQGDRPIVEYRRKRDEFKKANSINKPEDIKSSTQTAA